MAVTDADVPPPLLDIPKAKEKKYDRQLRLWGIGGQIALEETHILLINSGSGVTGVEMLKNLVLPLIHHPRLRCGVGGRSRCELLHGRCLAWQVPGSRDGHAITEPLETFITKDDVFSPYNLIVAAAPTHANILERIQTHSQTLHIPAFYFHSVGYLSSFSLLLPPAFPIVDTHPDSTATTDLRLLRPWSALSQFAKEKAEGLEDGTISAPDKAHIPWACLLLHYLEQWKQQHDGKVPNTYKEKSEFRNLVRAGDPNEENFEEAYAAVLKTLNPPTAPSAVREIFAAPETQQLDAASSAFWLIANAVAQFYAKHEQLPLPGAVPDMKAQSADYIMLQNIYKSKARDDCAEVVTSVRELEKQTGRSPKQAVDEKEVENFCKGAAHIHLVRGRPLQIAHAGQIIAFGDRAKAMASELNMPESLIGLHIAFLAWDEYVATHSTPASQAGGVGLKVPGSGADDFGIDTQRVTGIAHKIVDSLIKEAGTFVEDPEYSEVKDRVGKFCMEIVRAGGGELHNIASLTGGLLAQEVIKVITRQYIPVDNTCLFDGVASRTQVLRL
ncbi:hypothetical protein LTR91_024901 [Friedmanniomyces endolithicus]|uniref:NEDD8-activating enzyme E1 regulatory subunit n=1 Tax=Friedmanniomyces endolithicus TaxID=329885 RepID=A0AAN6H0Y1_9PEZI|nr:hypothetical protein LTR94_016808 [Friedmanniomyces endolithicus]KAK0787154.1 hypothetical protein LTR75_012994 [Friedmanniomyces endolithicus]KAK0790982.1 hypothetical protein LTR59_009062 [Friedmanniomyces endolithicus]KAK0797172.1 hypothetical protein LTR38_008308 [Friedmanniomyces endolithicus]KAK0839174.1 hypothetical protein LTR03_011432 [Friedmanniomyces endolithicus]